MEVELYNWLIKLDQKMEYIINLLTDEEEGEETTLTIKKKEVEE